MKSVFNKDFEILKIKLNGNTRNKHFNVANKTLDRRMPGGEGNIKA